MKQAPLLEVRRPLEARVAHLVRLYGVQDPAGLTEATLRIARRLGPQRTAAALAAIEARDWAAASRQMLDYYDSCYDHELDRHPCVASVELERLHPAAAADLLLREGLVRPLAASDYAGSTRAITAASAKPAA
jgi:tRNA 2-selenouridine synthase